MKPITTWTALIATLLLSATTRSAFADAGLDAQVGLNEYALERNTLENRWGATPNEDLTPEGCLAVIDSARAANVPGSYQMRSMSFEKVPGARKDGASFTITMREAAGLCEQYAAWRRVSEAAKLFHETKKTLDWLAMIDRSTNHEKNATHLAEVAARCTAGIDRLIAAGIPMDYAIEVSGRKNTIKVTVPEGKVQLCDALAAAASTFAAEVKSAKAELEDEVAAPYRKVGMTGDRLALMISHDGYAFYGAGGGELVTPSARKTAKLLFEVAKDGERIWTVTRYQFSGDKLTKTTSQEYLRKPGAVAFR